MGTERENPGEVHRIEISPPAWIGSVAPVGMAVDSREARMGLAIELARRNIERGDGGPFGAVVFEASSGRVIAAGVNSVVRLGNSSLHAEVVALMFAQRARGSYTLAEEPACELVTSCEPCAMCLGATLWSGVRRVVCGAGREDAVACGFDEGPVFEASYEYLRDRGIEVVRGVRRGEAAEVLREYVRRGGRVYNA